MSEATDNVDHSHETDVDIGTTFALMPPWAHQYDFSCLMILAPSYGPHRLLMMESSLDMVTKTTNHPSVNMKAGSCTFSEASSQGTATPSTEKELDVFFDQAKQDADGQHPDAYCLSTVQRQLSKRPYASDDQQHLLPRPDNDWASRTSDSDSLVDHNDFRSSEDCDLRPPMPISSRLQMCSSQQINTTTAPPVPRGVGAQFDLGQDPDTLRNLQSASRVDTVQYVRPLSSAIGDVLPPDLSTDAAFEDDLVHQPAEVAVTEQDCLSPLGSATDDDESSVYSQQGTINQHMLSPCGTRSTRSGYTSASPWNSQGSSGHLSTISSANYPGDSGNTIHSHGQKRPRDDPVAGQNGTEKANKLGNRSERIRSSGDREERLLACFFHKYDPSYFKNRSENNSKYKSCEKGFENTQMLTQHLRRVHGYDACICPKCFLKYDSEQKLTTHLREENCATRPMERIELEMWLVRGWDAWLRLVKEGKKKTNCSPETHWGHMWRAIFEGVACPSAYVEDNQSELLLRTQPNLASTDALHVPHANMTGHYPMRHYGNTRNTTIRPSQNPITNEAQRTSRLYHPIAALPPQLVDAQSVSFSPHNSYSLNQFWAGPQTVHQPRNFTRDFDQNAHWYPMNPQPTDVWNIVPHLSGQHQMLTSTNTPAGQPTQRHRQPIEADNATNPSYSVPWNQQMYNLPNDTRGYGGTSYTPIHTAESTQSTSSLGELRNESQRHW